MDTCRSLGKNAFLFTIFVLEFCQRKVLHLGTFRLIMLTIQNGGNWEIWGMKCEIGRILANS